MKPPLYITADKREIKDSPNYLLQLLYPQTLYAIPNLAFKRRKIKYEDEKSVVVDFEKYLAKL